MSVSKRLSWLLRHGAAEVGIELDPAGWADVGEVLRWLRADRPRLVHAVETNTKRRLQLEGDRIRCCQGHSLGVGVTLDGLEASWAPRESDATVWHGTNAAALTGIAADGIRAQARTHVHLAAELASTVGKRANVAVMLEVSPEGIALFEAPNGVVLTRCVPAENIVGLRAMTRAAKRDEDALREALGL